MSTLEVALTTGPTSESYFMVIGTQSEWEELMRNLDAIGHAPATLELLAGLKSWGLHK